MITALAIIGGVVGALVSLAGLVWTFIASQKNWN